MKLFCLIFVIVIIFLSGEFGTIEQSQGAAPLKLGISLSLTGNTSRTALGQAIWNGLQFWEDWYAANGTALTINGSDYTLELDVRDDQGDAGLMVANYHDLLNSSVAFLGPVNSDFSCILTPLFDSAKTMLLTSAAADQCSLGTDTFFSQLTPGSSTFKSAMLQSRLAGAKSFAWIAETQSYLQSACGALTTIGPESGMGLPVCNISVPGSTDAVITPERIAAWQQAMDQMATPECQADVLVLCMYPPAATVAIDRAKAINFSPKQITVTPLLTAYDSYANNLYLSGSTQWYQGVNFPADPYYGTPQQFLAAYQAKWGYAPDSFDAFGAEAPLVMMNALATASDLSTESISFALSRVDVSTFYGRVVFDARHGNLIDTVVIQYQPSGKNVVGPARAQTNDLIYPMPTWDEREPGYGWMVYSGDIVMAVIDGVCILFSLIMMVVVIAARNTDVFRAAQVEFVLITLLGSILVYLSIYTWLFYVTDASCMALPWLLATGFSMMFCALFAKTWRIHRVFNNPKLRSVKVTSWQIFGIIFADLALIWGLLIPWTIVDPLQQEIVKPDPYRPSQDYTVCAMGSVGTAFLITILVLQGVLLVIGAGMAFLIRNVKLALFNEAKYLGFCIYNMLVISAILVGLVAGSVGSNVDQFWIRVILITIAPLLVVGCLMIPKLFFLRSGANRRTATSSHPSHSGSNGPTRMTSGTFSSSPMPDSEEVNLLRAENAELRAEINQLRAAAAK